MLARTRAATHHVAVATRRALDVVVARELAGAVDSAGFGARAVDLAVTRPVSADHVARQVERTDDVGLARTGLRAVDRAHAIDARAFRATLVAEHIRIRVGGRLLGIRGHRRRIDDHGLALFGAANDVGTRAESIDADLTACALAVARARDGAIAERRLITTGDKPDVGNHRTNQQDSDAHAGWFDCSVDASARLHPAGGLRAQSERARHIVRTHRERVTNQRAIQPPARTRSPAYRTAA